MGTVPGVYRDDRRFSLTLPCGGTMVLSVDPRDGMSFVIF